MGSENTFLNDWVTVKIFSCLRSFVQVFSFLLIFLVLCAKMSSYWGVFDKDLGKLFSSNACWITKWFTKVLNQSSFKSTEISLENLLWELGFKKTIFESASKCPRAFFGRTLLVKSAFKLWTKSAGNKNWSVLLFLIL